jgi:hypothetical protein
MGRLYATYGGCDVGIIENRYAGAESCAFEIVKQDDAWDVSIGLEFNTGEMTWIPMLMSFYTEDAAFKWVQSLGPLFGNEDEMPIRPRPANSSIVRSNITRKGPRT